MSDDIVTPLHLQTIEKYMAHQSEMQQKNADDMRETMKQTQISLQQLASSVNELVMADLVITDVERFITDKINQARDAVTVFGNEFTRSTIKQLLVTTCRM